MMKRILFTFFLFFSVYSQAVEFSSSKGGLVHSAFNGVLTQYSKLFPNHEIKKFPGLSLKKVISLPDSLGSTKVMQERFRLALYDIHMLKGGSNAKPLIDFRLGSSTQFSYKKASQLGRVAAQINYRIGDFCFAALLLAEAIALGLKGRKVSEIKKGYNVISYAQESMNAFILLEYFSKMECSVALKKDLSFTDIQIERLIDRNMNTYFEAQRSLEALFKFLGTK